MKGKLRTASFGFLSWLVVIAALSGCAAKEILRDPTSTGYQMRCAIDVGSATTKLKLAKVDADRQRIKILYFEGLRSVPYHSGVENGRLTDGIVKEGVKAIQELLADAQSKLPADQPMPRCHGVATAAFRSAKNGTEALAWVGLKTGTKLAIIPQEEEARLGFYSGVAQGAGGRDAVVWDIGGGSMQLVARREEGTSVQFIAFTSGFGAEGFMKKVVTVVQQRQSPTANPMNGGDVGGAEELARKEARRIPDILKKQLADGATLVGIGGVHSRAMVSLFGLRPGQAYTLDQVEKAIVTHLGLEDSKFGGKSPQTMMTNLVLLSGFMKELKVKEVLPVDAGLADGVLVGPKYWEESSAATASR